MIDPGCAYPQSHEWFARAAKVIPGGIYGHTTPANMVPGAMPYFAERGAGCRYWDVDGREYLDYMCGYGPIILGHNHPEVEEAAARQRRDGNCFNHPTRRMVELAERLTALVDFADWAVFGKNGSDMTSWAVQVAREKTRRKKVLQVHGAYHGTHAWCTPGKGGLIREDRAHVHSFGWNDPEGFLRELTRWEGQVAAVILTPYHHPLYTESVEPDPRFLDTIETACRQMGIVLILDDIRAGFRLDLGGSHRRYGFTPDLACYCKALGNGYAISATVGSSALKQAATRVFLTGSYWNGAVSMAAALATLDILERDRVLPHLESMGQRLADGLVEAAGAHGIEAVVSGPPAIPFLTFPQCRSLHWNQWFSVEMAKRGVFFHPHHNWFLCAAHQPAEIDATLAAAREAFAVVSTMAASPDREVNA